MRVNMSIKRILIGTAMVGALALTSCSDRNGESKTDEPHPEAKNHITQNIGTIVSSQERILGIRHFGLPTLVFRGCGKGGDREFYNPDTDELILYMPREFVHFSPATTNDLIKHGLGHFYADKLSENLGNGSWPPQTEDAFDYIKGRLLTEGIAEYFRGKSSRDEKDTFDNSQWPINLEGFERVEDSIYYRGGYHLVKPIIDTYGKRGIEYLITHPPEKEDFENLPKYQQEILENLGKF